MKKRDLKKQILDFYNTKTPTIISQTLIDFDDENEIKKQAEMINKILIKYHHRLNDEDFESLKAELVEIVGNGVSLEYVKMIENNETRELSAFVDIESIRQKLEKTPNQNEPQNATDDAQSKAKS